MRAQLDSATLPSAQAASEPTMTLGISADDSPERKATTPVFSEKFERVVILVSTGRTGTTAIAQHFNACYDQVHAAHEPAPSRHLRVASNRFLCGRLRETDLVRIFSQSRQRLIASVSRPIYMESNPYLYGFIDVLDDIFDSPRLVHIVRDPRTYIRSCIDFGAFRGLKRLAETYYPFWVLKPDQYENSFGRRWRQMSVPERIAWRWNAVNSVLNRGAELFGERYLRVRFEDLFSKDGSGLQQLTDWIGLPWTPKLLAEFNKSKVNSSHESGFPKWQDWDLNLRHTVIHLCASLMTMYGYDSKQL